MSILTGAMLRQRLSDRDLCHSVQVCAKPLGKSRWITECQWKIAGINHMAWLLIYHDGKIYPEIKRCSKSMGTPVGTGYSMRLCMIWLYAESSEHNAEYMLAKKSVSGVD